MGKSSVSCFKMIACGGDSVEYEDLQATESKSSSDRRGWSFRKRSARHRILSNSVTTATPLSENKETPESTAVNFHVQPDSTVPEKTPVVQLNEEKTDLSAQVDSKVSVKTEEKTELSDQVDSKVSVKTEEKTELSAQLDSKASVNLGGAKEDDSGADATPDEPSIIVMQAAIRGLLAQRVLLKQKNIIKLQAVLRGHLVRRYAVGTLRCVQAIIRMQALVRARHGCLLAEGSGDSAKQREGSGNRSNDSMLLGKRKGKPNGAYTCVSIDKLLGNALARQLMESTPRTKPINIKCDPSKSDSAWKWLERWTAVSSVTSEEPQESDPGVEPGKEHIGHSNERENVLVSVSSDCYSEPTDFYSAAAASAETFKKDDKPISDDPNSSDNIHSFKPISPCSSHSDMHSIDGSTSRYEITEPTSIEIEETNLIEEVNTEAVPKEELNEQDGPDSISLPKEELNEQDGPDSKSLPKEDINEQDESDSKQFSAEQPEIVGKKLSRKPSNPAFIAAQSKFEELSSVAPSARLIKSAGPNPGVDSSADKVSSTDQPFRSRDLGLAENAVSNPSTVQIGGSESGTELSISSTLDSPEAPETGINDIGQKTKVREETDHNRSREIFEHETSGETMIPATDLSPKSEKLEGFESINSASGGSPNSMIALDSSLPEKKPEPEPSKSQPELGTEASHPVNKSSSPEGTEASRPVNKSSSPEASPRGHITVPESQTTPSTEWSVKPKKNKGEKRGSNRKNKSSPADKKSPPNHNQDSASRSSLEQLQEHKTGKRRNSLGSGKADHKEHGPRDSSSNNSLPSYMQATESARAKAIANGSPRSSPDMHEKDIYIKKRHSLPSSNDRQGSPRIQRSLSQAQQNTKGNVTLSPQERMWRR